MVLLTLLVITSVVSFNLNGGVYLSRKKCGEVSMMFDFFRQRTQEGIDQVKNIASKTLEGKLGEALRESVDYVKERNRIDAESLRQLSLGMARSRDRLLRGIFDSFGDGGDDVNLVLSRLEETLLQADIGASTTGVIIEDLRRYSRQEALGKDDILPVLRTRLIEALTPADGIVRGLNFAMQAPEGTQQEPTIIFVIGANGMGKTTTIGKLASRLRSELNMTVLLGACDTFRAAAVEQLVEWAVRANVSVEVPALDERGGDPVPVVTRTVRRAVEERYDVVIIDTSGRLSNNYELTMQLQGMRDAIRREIPSAPHETLLVVDGSLGRNAVEQAATWRKHVGVTGVAVTKMDGTARGGFVVSVVRDLGLPIKFIGVGEKLSDLRDFQPDLFVDALLGTDKEVSNRAALKMSKVLSGSSRNVDTTAGVGGGDDPAARLRAAFQSSSEDNSSGGQDNSVGVKKRKPTPKPQKLVKKKK